MALVDTSATHNFVSVEEAYKLLLKVKEGKGWKKAVNLEAKPVCGLARSVTITTGIWSGPTKRTEA